jgi:glycosyltransferase involved in cell wall biosynthesis
VVFSTSPHPTAHLIAQRIARACNAPSVIDFRDPWYEEPPEPGTPKIVHWYARYKERRVVGAAAHVIASTSSLRDLLRSRYPDVPPEKFSSILNGFDNADFAAVAPLARVSSGKLVILHAGSINGQFRDPRPLFAAMRKLIDAGAIAADSLRLRFLGPGEFAQSAAIAASLTEHRLGDCVEFLPRVDYQEGLRQMANADLLLLLQASDDTASLVPAKLYEYLRAQCPVLALVRPGAAADVLQYTGGGWHCDPADGNALYDTLESIVALARSNQLARHIADQERLGQFDRRALTGQLATIFAAVSERR